MAEDTDTLLAILASLLPEPTPTHEVLLDALARAGGDVDAAAKLLSASSSSKTLGKRKGRLDGWLKPEKPKSRRTVSPQRPIKPASSTSSSSRTAGSSKEVYSIFAPAKARSPSPTKATSSVSSSRTEGSLSGDFEEFHSVSPPSMSAAARPPSPTKKPPSSPAKPAAGPSRAPLSSSDKPKLNINEVLRPQPSLPKAPPRHPPLTLPTPALVAAHTPCTLHPSILPPLLASNLFHIMLSESRAWSRNAWFFFGRHVESPHTTAMYTRAGLGEDEGVEGLHEIARGWYNGKEKDPPRKFPPALEEACAIVEAAVNAEMRKRARCPLEWAGTHPGAAGDSNVLWKANVAAANLYEGAKEGVGLHADRLTSIGPYATIASISLGAARTFRLRESVPAAEQAARAARTFNVPLPHNSLLIMHAGTQEAFKHAVPPAGALDRFRAPFPPPPGVEPVEDVDAGACRINVTFRFARPDFGPASVPRCGCGQPCALRPDQRKRQRDGGAKGETEERGEYRYWWVCTAGEQNEGKTCGFWKVMDVRAEGRGPLAMDMDVSTQA